MMGFMNWGIILGFVIAVTFAIYRISNSRQSNKKRKKFHIAVYILSFAILVIGIIVGVYEAFFWEQHPMIPAVAGVFIVFVGLL